MKKYLIRIFSAAVCAICTLAVGVCFAMTTMSARTCSTCQGSTAATGLCLNMLGIPYEHVNHNKWTHQWCRVKMGEQYWIVDPYSLYCGPEPAPYEHPINS